MYGCECVSVSTYACVCVFACVRVCVLVSTYVCVSVCVGRIGEDTYRSRKDSISRIG